MFESEQGPDRGVREGRSASQQGSSLPHEATGAVALARQLAAAQPGPATAALAALHHPATCPPDVQVDLLVAWDRLAAWVTAQQAAVLASLPDMTDHGTHGNEDWSRETVSTALHVSAGVADDLLSVARALAGRLPSTLAALREGKIRYRQAAALSEAVEPLEDTAAALVESRVLDRATGQTTAETRRAIRRAVLAVDPRSAQERHERALLGREVTAWPTEDGMGQLTAHLSAEGLATVMAALDAVADRLLHAGAKGDVVPTVEARRADALVEIARAALGNPDLPLRHGSRPQIHVLVQASTLKGQDDAPAELAGYGAISAAQARRIAAAGERLPVPAAGNVGAQAVGGQYRPPASLRRYVLARDSTCRFPGCAVPSRLCDLDHMRPHGSGGPTSAANLAPLCRRHHRVKTHGGWKLRIDRTGLATWTSPTGHVYRSERESPLAGAAVLSDLPPPDD